MAGFDISLYAQVFYYVIRHKFILATGRDIRKDSADFSEYRLNPA